MTTTVGARGVLKRLKRIGKAQGEPVVWRGLPMFAAVRNGPTTLVAPLVAIYPLVTVILSPILLRHVRIAARIVAGTVLTVAGSRWCRPAS